jgi:hypothetical protein
MIMSWNIAKKEARHWIDSLNLQNISGRLIDLREPAQSLRFSGHFRLMVLRAAERLLKTRGAVALLPDEPDQDKTGI